MKQGCIEPYLRSIIDYNVFGAWLGCLVELSEFRWIDSLTKEKESKCTKSKKKSFSRATYTFGFKGTEKLECYG
jgi:hypothetical protein